MKKKLLAIMMCLVSLMATAQVNYGKLVPLHVDGNQFKDPSGNTVVLHGVMDTPNPYFNSYRWGGSCSDATVSSCINYFDKLFTAITDSTYENALLENRPSWHETRFVYHYAPTRGMPWHHLCGR